jgi:hypothetical protein
LLAAPRLDRLRERRPAAGRVAVAALLVATALYAGVGTAQYASMPRDEAGEWVREHVREGATMETYQWGFEHVAGARWVALSHPYDEGPPGEAAVACPAYVQLVHEDLLYLRDVPDSERVRYVRSNASARASYLRGLLNGTYGYEVVATFGDPPPDYVPHRAEPGSLVGALGAGTVPQSDRYGDDQELAARQTVVILARNGTVAGARTETETGSGAKTGTGTAGSNADRACRKPAPPW